MSKETTIIALGIWVIIVPYLGIPTSWKTILLVLAGFAIVMIGFFQRTQGLAGNSKSRNQIFVENVSPATPPPGHDRKEGITSLN
jgi:membrane-bound ClpP family serine protease